MKDDLQKYLDGELPLDALDAEQRASALQWDRLLVQARESEERAPDWLAARVMQDVHAQPPARSWRSALRWLIDHTVQDVEDPFPCCTVTWRSDVDGPLVVSVDAAIEHEHFRRDWLGLDERGHKWITSAMRAVPSPWHSAASTNSRKRRCIASSS